MCVCVFWTLMECLQLRGLLYHVLISECPLPTISRFCCTCIYIMAPCSCAWVHVCILLREKKNCCVFCLTCGFLVYVFAHAICIHSRLTLCFCYLILFFFPFLLIMSIKCLLIMDSTSANRIVDSCFHRIYFNGF